MFRERLRDDVVHVDLWRAYLQYTRNVCRQDHDGFDKISRAFDIALDDAAVGADPDCSVIWLDYLDFLKSHEATGEYNTNLKRDMIRRIYHRAISTPATGIERIWQEYNMWENAQNAALARKLIKDQSGPYMRARGVREERARLFERVNRQAMPRPPTGDAREARVPCGRARGRADVADRTATPAQLEYVQAWQSIIAYEKQNTLNVPPAALTNRVFFMYKQVCARAAIRCEPSAAGSRRGPLSGRLHRDCRP